MFGYRLLKHDLPIIRTDGSIETEGKSPTRKGKVQPLSQLVNPFIEQLQEKYEPLLQYKTERFILPIEYKILMDQNQNQYDEEEDMDEQDRIDELVMSGNVEVQSMAWQYEESEQQKAQKLAKSAGV